jgi:hypothetical protein
MDCWTAPAPELHEKAMTPQQARATIRHRPRSMRVPMRQVYLDYNASTPIDPRVADAMRPLLDDAFGNR